MTDIDPETDCFQSKYFEKKKKKQKAMFNLCTILWKMMPQEQNTQESSSRALKHTLTLDEKTFNNPLRIT